MGTEGGGAAGAAAEGEGAAGGGADGGGRETVLVVFLGGATFTELSALRFLEGQPGARVRFVIMVTKIINGRTLLEGFVDPLVRGYPGGPRAAAV